MAFFWHLMLRSTARQLGPWVSMGKLAGAPANWEVRISTGGGAQCLVGEVAEGGREGFTQLGHANHRTRSGALALLQNLTHEAMLADHLKIV